ncbi:TPA: hypothetical protein ACX3FZ_004439 [Vibrio parahaemolyticus]|uniref:hypothetical protein n=2 Tax=Vibrio TaxID=662 RepID=UPI002362A0D5|nr:hypothetical protein [Vibrio parahaemolyticus]
MLDSAAKASIEKLLLEKSTNAGFSAEEAQDKISQVMDALNDPSQTLNNTIVNELVGIVMMDQRDQETALVELALKTGSQMEGKLTGEQNALLDSLRQG